MVDIQVTNNTAYAYDASFSVLHDRELTGRVYGYDPDGDGNTTELETDVSHGDLTLNPDGTFTYIPNSGFIGTDSFTFTWSDGLANGNTATVTIGVYNSGPVAYSYGYRLWHDRELSVAEPGLYSLVFDPDGDRLTISIAEGGYPQHGQLVLGTNGSFVYTPPALWTGVDWFIYEVSDGVATAQATVYMYVENTAPRLVRPMEFLVHPGEELVLTRTQLAGYFEDEDGDTVEVDIDLDSPQNSHVADRMRYDSTIDGWRYSAAAEFEGSEEVEVRFTDRVVALAAPAKIIVAPGNRPPRFGPEGGDLYEFYIGELWREGWEVGQVTAQDPDGEQISYEIWQASAEGWFKIDANTGVISVARNLTYQTPQQVQLTVGARDGRGGISLPAYVYINIVPTVIIAHYYNQGQDFTDGYANEAGDTFHIVFQRLSRDLNESLDFTYEVNFRTVEPEDIRNIRAFVDADKRKTLSFARGLDVATTPRIRAEADGKAEPIEYFKVSVIEPADRRYRTFPGLSHDEYKKVAGGNSTLVYIADGWTLFAGGNDEAFRQDGQGRTIHWNDVRQGWVNDCNLAAAIAAIAYDSPQTIRDMFRIEANNTVSVRVYDGGREEWINLRPELVRGLAQMSLSGDYTEGETSRLYEIWPILIEEAFVRKFGWQNVNAGAWFGDRLRQLTNIEAEFMQINNQDHIRRLREFLDLDQQQRPRLILSTPDQFGGKDGKKKDEISLPEIPNANNRQEYAGVVAGRESNARSLVGNHAYVVLGYWDNDRGEHIGLVLFNPWNNPEQAGGFLAKVTFNEMIEYHLHLTIHPKPR